MDPLTVSGAVSHRHAEIAARLDSWATALVELRAATCSLTLFHPSFPAPPALANTHRTRRMHSLNWPGHCARCGLRPRHRASRTYCGRAGSIIIHACLMRECIARC